MALESPEDYSRAQSLNSSAQSLNFRLLLHSELPAKHTDTSDFFVHSVCCCIWFIILGPNLGDFYWAGSSPEWEDVVAPHFVCIVLSRAAGWWERCDRSFVNQYFIYVLARAWPADVFRYLWLKVPYHDLCAPLADLSGARAVSPARRRSDTHTVSKLVHFWVKRQEPESCTKKPLWIKTELFWLL